MSEYPPVTIVMTTWFIHPERVKVAQQALKSWCDYLRYEGNLHLHVADDGSELAWEPANSWYNTNRITFSRQEREGVGASLNKGFKQAFECSPIVLYMVDDWFLTQPFDLAPWVHLLVARTDVGIVRLGPPHPQEGEPYYFKRRTPAMSEMSPELSLEDLYDHIRMLSAEGYPLAFITWGDYRLEFEDPAFYNGGYLGAKVRILKND